MVIQILIGSYDNDVFKSGGTLTNRNGGFFQHAQKYKYFHKIMQHIISKVLHQVAFGK
jgi:hypothetical protein